MPTIAVNQVLPSPRDIGIDRATRDKLDIPYRFEYRVRPVRDEEISRRRGPSAPPFRFANGYGETDDHMHLTDGFWIVRLELHSSLRGYPRCRPPVTPEMIARIWPGPGVPIPSPSYAAVDRRDTPVLFGWSLWSHQDQRARGLWFTPSEYFWITRRLRCDIGWTGDPTRPQAIMTAGKVVGAIMSRNLHYFG